MATPTLAESAGRAVNALMRFPLGTPRRQRWDQRRRPHLCGPRPGLPHRPPQLAREAWSTGAEVAGAPWQTRRPPPREPGPDAGVGQQEPRYQTQTPAGQ